MTRYDVTRHKDMEHIYSCKIFNVNKEKNEYEKIYGEDVKTKYRVFKSK